MPYPFLFAGKFWYNKMFMYMPVFFSDNKMSPPLGEKIYITLEIPAPYFDLKPLF